MKLEKLAHITSSPYNHVSSAHYDALSRTIAQRSLSSVIQAVPSTTNTVIVSYRYRFTTPLETPVRTASGTTVALPRAVTTPVAVILLRTKVPYRRNCSVRENDSGLSQRCK